MTVIPMVRRLSLHERAQRALRESAGDPARFERLLAATLTEADDAELRRIALRALLTQARHDHNRRPGAGDHVLRVPAPGPCPFPKTPADGGHQPAAHQPERAPSAGALPVPAAAPAPIPVPTPPAGGDQYSVATPPRRVPPAGGPPVDAGLAGLFRIADGYWSGQLIAGADGRQKPLARCTRADLRAAAALREKLSGTLARKAALLRLIEGRLRSEQDTVGARCPETLLVSLAKQAGLGEQEDLA